MNENRFEQKFDIIVTRSRLTLDIDKGYYPGDKVTFYLNGTTGKISHKLEDVVQDGIPYIKEDYEIATKENTGFNCVYHKGRVYFHIVKKNSIASMSEGQKISWKEIYRFSIGKNLCVYTKYNATLYNDKTKQFLSSRFSDEIKDDGAYNVRYGKGALPFSVQNWQNNVYRYVNENDGTKNGFSNVIQNVVPVVFNVSGNVYKPIVGYEELFEYFSVMENGLTCQKKSGKKQDYIDKMVALELPELQKPTNEQIDKYRCDEVKMAEICKVEGADEPTCVVRTYSYIPSIDVLFEGGRIYVTKKTAEFCKKNNAGEYVAQAFLSRIEHWDFEVEKFLAQETVGTKLEYFGQIIPDIMPENRAIAIWMFLREPFMESLAKLTSCDFVDAIIKNLRHVGNIDHIYNKSLGVSDKGAKKIFNALGINKQQFEEMKDIFVESLGYRYFIEDSNELSLGILPFIKWMIGGSSNENIAAIDINTFKTYLDFAIDIFSMKQIFGKQSDVMAKLFEQILSARDTTLRYYSSANIETLLPMFEQMASEFLKHTTYSYYNNGEQFFRFYNDYLSMAWRMDDRELYKPKFKTLDEMVLAHDNLSIYSNVQYDRNLDRNFQDFYSSKWSQYEFKQEEEKDKKGNVKKEALKWMVVAPKTPIELVKEGTLLHHCVKTYIERVAEGITNIVFIRDVNEPNIPFFTVEVSNENTIEQVHGFANRNADTEEGLEEFIEIWAKARHLKKNSINKVR